MVTLICSPLYHNRRLMITYRRNNRQAYLALKVLWLKIIHKFVRIVENISPCPLLPRVKSGILLVLYLEVCSTLPFKKSFCYARKIENAIVEFSARKKFLLTRKIIIMLKVFFVLVSELDGFFQKFRYPNPFICFKWLMFWIGYKEHGVFCR